MSDWKLRSGHVEVPGTGRWHPTITESTTGTVACGDSWCTGTCGLPALVLEHEGVELRAFGQMVAVGSVFQAFRGPWTGKKLPVTLPGGLTSGDVVRRIWC